MRDIRMGLNLGFIARIQLVDGTIVQNMHILCNAPIPEAEQIEQALAEADKAAGRYIRELDDSYSMGVVETA